MRDNPQLHFAANGDFESELVHRGCFGQEAFTGGFLTGGVSDLDMVGLVAGHHLIAGDSGQDGVEDWPLRCGEIPAFPGFRVGQ